MRWAVEIESIEGEERLLTETLAAIDIDLKRNNDGLFLTGKPFECLDHQKDVRDLGKDICAKLNEVSKLRADLDFSIELGSAIWDYADGEKPRKHHYLDVQSGVLVLDGGNVTLRVTANSPEEQERLEGERREREFQERREGAISVTRAILSTPRVIDVLRLLDGEVSVQDMNHVAELIEDDLGRELMELVSKRQLVRFNHSINHPDVFGLEARHAVSRKEPPPKPMSMNEARAFVKDMAERWIRLKAALPAGDAL